MEIIGVLGIILAIVAVIAMTVKGLDILIAAPLATLIVLVTNQMPILEWMFGSEQSYMVELGSFLVSMFGLFVLGAVLTQFMEASGATRSIADQILRWIGTEDPYRAMIAIIVIGAVMTYGGINAFIIFFAILPISRSIFKELDINWSLITIPLFTGIGTFTMTMLPGTPSPTNVVPTETLGTTLTTGPLLGIAASLAALIFNLVFMRYRLKQSLENGETFNSYKSHDKLEAGALGEESEEELNKELPSFLVSILPLFTLILMIFVFSDVENIVVVGLSAASVLAMVLYRNYISTDYIEVLNSGGGNAIGPLIATASSVAFGTLLIYADGFNVILELLQSISPNILVLVIILAAILGGVTGSATGGVAIVMNTLGDDLLASGIAPAVIHRVSALSSGLLVQMPHSGSYITFRKLSGLSIQDSYKDAFITMFGGHLVGLIAMLIVAYVAY